MVEDHREGDQSVVGGSGHLHGQQQRAAGQDHGGEGSQGDWGGGGPGPGGDEQECLRLQGEEAPGRQQVPIGGAERGNFYVTCQGNLFCVEYTDIFIIVVISNVEEYAILALSSGSCKCHDRHECY